MAPAILRVNLLASGLEQIRYYGVGNETNGSQPDTVYRVRQRQLFISPTVTSALAPRLRLELGPTMKYFHTPADRGTVLAASGGYYGTGNFGEIGAYAVLELDTRDAPVAAAEGVRVRFSGDAYPAFWSATAAFATIAVEAMGYLSVADPPAATLALRLGGAHASGTVPFQELVYIGGATTVRGYPEQRFAGTSGAYANAELRLAAARLAPGDVGILGLGDLGRVWAAGASSDRWHGAAGGGVWFAWRHRRADTISLAVAASPERTALYFQAGFMF